MGWHPSATWCHGQQPHINTYMDIGGTASLEPHLLCRRLQKSLQLHVYVIQVCLAIHIDTCTLLQDVWKWEMVAKMCFRGISVSVRMTAALTSSAKPVGKSFKGQRCTWPTCKQSCKYFSPHAAICLFILLTASVLISLLSFHCSVIGIIQADEGAKWKVSVNVWPREKINALCVALSTHVDLVKCSLCSLSACLIGPEREAPLNSYWNSVWGLMLLSVTQHLRY